MIALLAIAVLAQGAQVPIEVAEGLSGHIPVRPGEPPEMDLDEVGEAFKVHRQGKNVRVDLGKSVVLLSIGGAEYIIADLDRKVGVRHPGTHAKDKETILEMGRWTVGHIFPLWPDKYMGSLPKADRDEFLKLEAAGRSEAREDPIFGEVVDVTGGISLTRRADPDAVPSVVRWHKMDGSGLFVIIYTSGFEKAKGPAKLFTAPEGVRLEEFASLDKKTWTVFKDEADYAKWRSSLVAGKRKPKRP